VAAAQRADGGYALAVAPGECQVRVSQAGYVDDLAELTVGAGAQVTHNVALAPDAPGWRPTRRARTDHAAGEQRRDGSPCGTTGAASCFRDRRRPGGRLACGLTHTGDRRRLWRAIGIAHAGWGAVLRYGWHETEIALTSNDPELPTLYLPVRMGTLQLIQLPMVNG